MMSWPGCENAVGIDSSDGMALPHRGRALRRLTSIAEDNRDIPSTIENLATAQRLLANAEGDSIDALIFAASKMVGRLAEDGQLAQAKEQIEGFDGMLRALYRAKDEISRSRADRESREYRYVKLAQDVLPRVLDLIRAIQISGLDYSRRTLGLALALLR